VYPEYIAQGGLDRSITMKTMILYFMALTGIMLASWQIQEIHLGWGYTLGVLGLLVAFFVAVNSLTTGRRK
jgi:hypothetical protein